MSSKISKFFIWSVALVLAASTGWLQIMFRDLHLALLAAMSFCLFLSLADDHRPWKWALLVGFAPFLAEMYLIMRGQPAERGAIQVALAAILPAGVGSAGGYMLRKMVNRLYEKPPAEFVRTPHPPEAKTKSFRSN